MNSIVHYIRRLDFWIGLADAGNRYWNALGTGNPFKESRAIIAEINFPKAGIDRRISGTFLRDGTGKLYMAHRGRVGGGRMGIGKKAFMAWYQSAIDLIDDDGRQNEIIVIGAVNDGKLIANLDAFTRKVAAFKEEVTSAFN